MLIQGWLTATGERSAGKGESRFKQWIIYYHIFSDSPAKEA